MNGRKARAGLEVEDEHDDDIVKLQRGKVDGPEAEQNHASMIDRLVDPPALSPRSSFHEATAAERGRERVGMAGRRSRRVAHLAPASEEANVGMRGRSAQADDFEPHVRLSSSTA
jgi:hypothetical protein